MTYERKLFWLAKSGQFVAIPLCSVAYAQRSPLMFAFSVAILFTMRHVAADNEAH